MEERQLQFHSPEGKRKILVVEDELINREMLSYMLQDTYEVLNAENGREALETIRSHYDTISLILLDLNLPDMHGLEVLKQVRANQHYARLPVIVMTADKDAEVESLSFGAIDFIPKPYPQPKVVLARVLRTIELFEDKDLIRNTERDSLTGLYTKEYFYRYVSQHDLYHRSMPMDAIVLDINHFHMLNERYGKSRGDQVLIQVGARISEYMEAVGGLACRREADTFLLYCPHLEDYADLMEHVSITLDTDGEKTARIRLRMGVYTAVDKGIYIDLRFDRAKIASDTVKNNFTKSIAIYDNSLHEAEVLSEQLIEDFPAAISQRQFVVWYQPKFNIQGQEPLLGSAEALVRWNHPKLGMISPGTFIPLFESNGLIHELDEYVWKTAAAQIKDWKDRFGVTVPVSVNVSRSDMYGAGFVEKMKEIVDENQLHYSELLLEITEYAYTTDSEQIISIVKQLRQIGFRIEMDDFGSGYSSLSMLASLPIDALKLDMQFIRNAFKERKDTRMLEAVIQLADSLEVPTVAEGVETAEQMLTLKAMGCDIVQGYYFSRPVPAGEFEVFVTGKRIAELKFDKGGRSTPHDRFTYDALHDPTTGLYNFTAFDILFYDSDQDHIAILIVDVDDYERIKRENGRACADRIAKKVAMALRSRFRSVDYVCRLKEDEFAVIMTRVNSTMRDLVNEKVQRITESLKNDSEIEVPFTISVGVAFSDREKPQGDIFQDADTALDRVKETRRSGCEFYGG